MSSAEPSLLLAKHHIAHREHNHNHLHQHEHQHRSLHNRQAAQEEPGAVTEVVQTVSVIQQINVDNNGNTVSTFYTQLPEPSSTVVTSSAIPTGSDAVPSMGAALASQAPLTEAVTSSTSATTESSLSTASSLSSSESASTSVPSTASTFASLLLSSNSTTLISSSSSLSPTFSNSTTSSVVSSKSSLTYLTSEGSSSSSDAFITSIPTSWSSNESPDPTSAGVAGGFVPGGGTAVESGALTSSTSTSGGGSGSNDSTPATPTPIIIGSVVSSVAGAAVLVLVFLFIWRWRKRTRTMLPLGNGEPGLATISGGTPAPPSSGMMVERRSFAHAVPAALASLTARANIGGYKRSSQRTETGTISSTAGSERGFYRVSGRKITSVLQSGGDGYGERYEEPMPSRGFNDDRAGALSGSSWYRDSQGFSGGPGTSSIRPLEMASITRDSGVPVMRPSPARTPVTEQGPFTSIPLNPPTRDPLGRSHPSRDGSHASKFMEEV